MASASHDVTEFFGQWKSESYDNFDEYLKQKGVNFLLRKLIIHSNVTTDITREPPDSDTNAPLYRLHTYSKSRDVYDYKFALGQEFKSKNPDGSAAIVKFWFENGILYQTIREDVSGNTEEMERTISSDGNHLTLTMKTKDVVSVHKFLRVSK